MNIEGLEHSPYCSNKLNKNDRASGAEEKDDEIMKCAWLLSNKKISSIDSTWILM